MKNYSSLTAVVIAAALTVTSATSAFALPRSDPNEKSYEQQISDIVSQSTPIDVDSSDVPAVSKNGIFESDGDVPVLIPSDSSAPIEIRPDNDSPISSLKFFLDHRISNDGVLTENGTVVFGGHELSQTIEPTEEGVRINTVIPSERGPEEVRHRLHLPAGFSLVTGNELEAMTPENSKTKALKGVFVLNSDNQLVGGVSAPWAVDSEGTPVATYYSVEGDTIVQHIDHKGHNLSYPVVADPWLGFNLIASAKWRYRGKGWTLMVSPTKWARVNAPGYAVGVAGWNELYKKYKNKGLNKNLGGMKKQYICHQQFAFWKTTWNLDEWRPNVSYAQTVNAKCNPGGGKIID